MHRRSVPSDARATIAAVADIPTRPLGKTGERVSILGLGGWHLGLPPSDRAAARIVHAAIDAGITFLDNSLLSAGPNSVLAIDRFAFDSTTHQGAFESSLKRGTLSVVSGKLAKQSAEAMKVKTPAAVLGVRGTEFLVRTGAPKD